MNRRLGSIIKSFLWNAINTNYESILISKTHKTFNAVGKIKLNEWQGKKSVEFIIEDISLN